MKQPALIIEKVYKAPVELVWRAITEKELMKKWYFDIADFKLEVGAVFHFEGGTEERCYTHICEIIEIIPLQKLKYSWRYQGYSGVSYVTFELFAEGPATRLKLTHAGIETLGPENKDFARENFVGGWKYLIHESLLNFLTSKQT